MAGMIKVSDGASWMYSSWVYNAAMEYTRKHIPESLPSLRQLIDDSSNLQYLSLWEKCTDGEVRAFVQALRDAYSELESVGSPAFHDPSFFPQFMQALHELLVMVQEAVDSNCGDPG